MTETKHPAGNEDFAWAQFDPEAYFRQYYGDPHADDDTVVASASLALRHAGSEGRALSVVDVGTGPNLFPLMCALPVASRLTAWEYSASNVAWLKAELANPVMRPQWRHFWDVVASAYGPGGALPTDPMPALREKTSVMQGSVFDLPERRWDAATMFFCAESITERRDQFEAACRCYARCVRPGGALVAAFLVGSSGYAVSERPFPVLNISEADIHEVFAPLASGARTQPIGIVEREIRSGYSGMVLLVANAL